MAKWINTSTGAVVPAAEVRELSPGTGVFVHERTVTFDRIKTTLTDRGRVLDVEVVSVTEKRVDAFVVRIADDATYDPQRDNIASQALAFQAAARAKEGARS